MNLSIKRDENETKGVLIKTQEYDSCVVVVCAEMTSDDHVTIRAELQMELGAECKADLYFTRNMTSIFIFDAETLTINSDDIKQIIPDTIHNTIYNGSVYGRRIQDLNVVRSKTDIKVSKKWKTLLTINRG